MFQVHIDGSLEAVWNEITRTDQPIPAFFNNQMHRLELAAGSPIAMRSKDGAYTGVVGEILEVIPHKRFAHTFKFTNYDDPPCTVIYDLEPTDSGVKFTLTVKDLPVGTKTGKSMSSGGTMIVNTLKAVIETGRPKLPIRILYVLFRVLQPISPKRCRTEHWPLEARADRA